MPPAEKIYNRYKGGTREGLDDKFSLEAWDIHVEISSKEPNNRVKRGGAKNKNTRSLGWGSSWNQEIVYNHLSNI